MQSSQPKPNPISRSRRPGKDGAPAQAPCDIVQEIVFLGLVRGVPRRGGGGRGARMRVRREGLVGLLSINLFFLWMLVWRIWRGILRKMVRRPRGGGGDRFWDGTWLFCVMELGSVAAGCSVCCIVCITQGTERMK